MQKVDGKLYGVQGYVNLLGLWYNQDMLDQARRRRVPTTTDELEADMAKAAAAGKQGITLTGKPGSRASGRASPGSPRTDSPTVTRRRSRWRTPTRCSRTGSEKGYLSKEAATWDQTVPFQQFAAGASLFAVNGNWQIAAAKEAEFKYGVAPLPITRKAVCFSAARCRTSAPSRSTRNWPRSSWKTRSSRSTASSTLLDTFGAIPARADAAASSKIGEDPILSVFADIVQKQGRPSPSPQVPSKNVNERRDPGRQLLEQGRRGRWQAGSAGGRSDQAARPAAEGLMSRMARTSSLHLVIERSSPASSQAVLVGCRIRRGRPRAGSAVRLGDRRLALALPAAALILALAIWPLIQLGIDERPRRRLVPRSTATGTSSASTTSRTSFAEPGLRRGRRQHPGLRRRSSPVIGLVGGFAVAVVGLVVDPRRRRSCSA